MTITEGLKCFHKTLLLDLYQLFMGRWAPEGHVFGKCGGRNSASAPQDHDICGLERWETVLLHISATSFLHVSSVTMFERGLFQQRTMKMQKIPNSWVPSPSSSKTLMYITGFYWEDKKQWGQNSSILGVLVFDLSTCTWRAHVLLFQPERYLFLLCLLFR
jgi:hypothetical protein